MIRRLEHSRILLEIHRLPHFTSFLEVWPLYSWIASSESSSWYRGLFAMHAHSLELYPSSRSLIMSIYFVVIGMDPVRSTVPARRFGRFQGFGRGIKSHLLRFLFLFHEGWMQSVWGYSSPERRWSSSFILVGTSHSLIIKVDLISDGNLPMLFYRMSDWHCNWQLLDKIQRVLLDDVFRLGKVIDHHVPHRRHPMWQLSLEPSQQLVKQASFLLWWLYNWAVSSKLTILVSTIASIRWSKMLSWNTCRTNSIIRCISGCAGMASSVSIRNASSSSVTGISTGIVFFSRPGRRPRRSKFHIPYKRCTDGFHSCGHSLISFWSISNYGSL